MRLSEIGIVNPRAVWRRPAAGHVAQGVLMRNVYSVALMLVLALLVGAGPALAASWTTGPELPTPRAEVGAAVANGLLDVLGGGVGVYQTSNDVLDLSSGAWRKGAPLPKPLNHHGVTSLNGKVYVL